MGKYKGRKSCIVVVRWRREGWTKMMDELNARRAGELMMWVGVDEGDAVGEIDGCVG
jgi:hypothetical protein